MIKFNDINECVEIESMNTCVLLKRVKLPVIIAGVASALCLVKVETLLVSRACLLDLFSESIGLHC